MSARHPNISAWQRDGHEGVYSRELAGFALRVTWTPNAADTRGTFAWTVEHAGAKPHRSHERFEEMSAAMADAEDFARVAAAKQSH